MTLIPITNLGELSDSQRTDYLIQVCQHLDIPPHLNLLEFIMMEHGDGTRNLVLYAKKGATDMLRKKMNISVDELVRTDADGCVTFTARGHNAEGRTEIAVGASYVGHLTGKELATQIMVAQTRACRRLTLQFVGGGFLDESEVQPAPVAAISEVGELPVSKAAPPRLNAPKSSNADISKSQRTATSSQTELALSPLDIPGIPTSAELSAYRDRLTNVTQNVLPKAGMVPTAGVGGVAQKARNYIMLRYRIQDIRNLTCQQWGEVLRHLESADPAGLVKEIDKAAMRENDGTLIRK